MPTILPIRELRDTSKISEIAHKQQEPIHITKNGYNDLVIMSSELYEKYEREFNVDQAITEAELDYAQTGEVIDAKDAFVELERKYLV